MIANQHRCARKAMQGLVVASALFGFGQFAQAANDVFLSIPEIPGESVHPRHPGSIEAAGFVETLVGKGCSRFTVTKSIDIATPLLADAVARGAVLSSATLSVQRAAEGVTPFYKVTMETVTVLSAEQSAGATDLGQGVEKIVLSPKSVTINYTATDPKGAPGGTVRKTLTCI